MDGFSRIALVLSVMAAVLLSGCHPNIGREVTRPAMAGPGQALVTLYLETVGAGPANITLILADVEVLQEGVWLPVVSGPVEVNLARDRERQTLLGLGVLPAGRHEQFRFRIQEVRQGRRVLALASEQSHVVLEAGAGIQLDEGDSHCLFLRWQLDDCLDSQERFVPRFSLKAQTEPLTSELLYVLCDDINTLYLARSDRNFIVYSLAVDGPVSDLSLDKERQLLYILSRGARALLVFDCQRNRIVDRVALPVTVDPRYLALSTDGIHAFVSDAATDRVVKVDLRSGQLVQQASVGYRPGRLIYFDDGSLGRVAVSSPGSQQVFILDAQSLSLVSALSSGFQPEGLFVAGSVLYVCDRGSQTVTAWSLRSRSVLSHIPVGREPVSLAGDGGDKIYVANYGDQNLSVITRGQNMALRQIPVGRGPYSFAYLGHRNVLYVANRLSQTVTALDIASERPFATLALGGTPLFLAVQD
ncbi:hypothetical protein AOP6_1143 [Desulfuromonas sp. AOP6]|nr:hypothetical protein AOP6_1143 [Desulfuromonas sp. AOP6]